MTNIRFATESYLHDSKPLSAQRAINCYAERQPKGAKVPIAVFGVPGISTFTTLGSGPIRALFEMNEVAYAVSGQNFYTFDETGASTLLGTGITGYKPVSVDGTGFEIVIRNGLNGFSYVLSPSSFAQISDGDFQQGNTVTVLNNIFCFDWLNTNKFFTSEVLDGRTYDALDFASAESDPDFIKAVRAHNGTLFLLGNHTIEPWDNTGAADFAFSRIKGGTIDRGVIASLAVENEDSSMFILGDDLIAYRINGLQLQRISTHALEREWRSYSTTSDVFSFKISDSGHKFIYFTFPTENRTFAYDIATGLWHERMSWDAGGMETRWRANCAVTAYSKTLIGDANSGKIGFVDPSVYTEFGDPIISTMTSPPLYMDGQNISVPVLEVDMHSGVGLTTGQGSDPQVMLDWSTDGGRTYTAPQEWASFGMIGDNRRRVIFNGLGEGYEFTFRLRISDPVKRVVYAARCPGLYAAR